MSESRGNRMRRLPLVVAAVIALSGVPGSPVGGQASGGGAATYRVSVPAAGASDTDGASSQAAISQEEPGGSAAGRHVAFVSSAGNLLVPEGEGGAGEQVYVRDRDEEVTRLVSATAAGAPGGGDSTAPSVDATGQVVVFASDAADLVVGDTNAATDVFLWNGETVELVSEAAGGGAAGGPSRAPAVSADGSVVAFESDAGDLVADDTNGATDVFVWDRQSGETRRLSAPPFAVTEGNGASFEPDLSAHGEVVAFSTRATNLVAGEDATGLIEDVVVATVAPLPALRRVQAGEEQPDGGAREPSVSGDGARVAFVSDSTNIGEAGGSGLQVYVHDATESTARLVSTDGRGGALGGDPRDPDLSGDGRFVVFDTTADPAGPPATALRNVRLADLVCGTTQRLSVAEDPEGTPEGASAAAAVSWDGTAVAFTSAAANLGDAGGGPPDANGFTDVYLRNPAGPDSRCPPVARLRAEPALVPGPAPAHVVFDAAASGAPGGGEIVGYDWDFGDDTPPVHTTGPTTEHDYAQAGLYQATVRVTDDGDAQAAAEVVVFVGDGNVRPTAEFAASPERGAPPLEVVFDASASTDPDGTVVSHTWDFGDGGEPEVTPLPFAVHAFAEEGEYRVALTVTDDGDAVATTTHTVVVSGDLPPAAAFTAEQLAGTAPATVVFDASASADDAGPIARYRWVFGDASAPLETTAPVVEHTYESGGTFTPTLVVADSRGQESSYEMEEPITVEGTVENRPPDAEMSLGYEGEGAPADVTFDGSGSSDPDPDDEVVAFLWDFGDGTAPAEGPDAAHTYTAAGAYSVTLTVTDTSGASDTAARTLTIEPENVAPRATVLPDVDEGSLQGPAPHTVTLHAAAADADGEVARLDWDFGDGTVLEDGPTTAAHTYETPGEYAVRLTVTDDRGAAAVFDLAPRVVVGPPNPPPRAAFDLEPSERTLPVTVAVDGSASTDDTGVVDWAWDFGDGSAGVHGATASHTFAVEGAYTISLTVTDGQGAKDTAVTALHAVAPAATPNTQPVTSVTGSGGYGSASGAGAATTELSVRTVRILWWTLYYGTVKVRDPGTGLDVGAVVLGGPAAVARSGTEGARGTAMAFGRLTATRAGFATLAWEVDDLSARGLGPDLIRLALPSVPYAVDTTLTSGDVTVLPH